MVNTSILSYKKKKGIFRKTKANPLTASMVNSVHLYLSFCFCQIAPQIPNALTNCSFLTIIWGLQPGIILSEEEIVTTPVWFRPRWITWCRSWSLSVLRSRRAFSVRTPRHITRNMIQDTFQLLRTQVHWNYIATFKFPINCSLHCRTKWLCRTNYI